jgi:hypothetical protein
MLMVMMLSALKHDVDHIHSEITYYFISDQTATSEVLSSRIEQEVIFKAKHKYGSGGTRQEERVRCLLPHLL